MSSSIKPIEIVHSAQSQGINLRVDKGRLAIKKERNSTLSPDLIQLIKENRDALIDFLQKEVRVATQPQTIQIKKVPEADGYRVSNGQFRLWLMSHLEKDFSAYNMPNTILLEGYDIAAFQKAVEAVIQRHEILRTVFKLDESDEVRQYVRPFEDLDFTIEILDFRKEDDPEETARSFVTSDSYRPFDLENGPLLRAALIQLTNEQYLFYYNTHHIISDEWSLKVLAGDVMHYYQAYANGRTLMLPPLRIQYKDYAAWQLEQLEQPAYQAHKAFWLDLLSGEVARINLPTSKKRPAVKTFNGRSVSTALSGTLTGRLRNFATERNGSLFLGLLSVWKILLYRYTGETDLTLGIPLSGRDHTDLENQIGFYVNTLALRNRIDPRSSFEQFFNQIKEHTLEAYRHQMYPFDKILEELKLQRDPARSLLFDTLFNFHGAQNQTNSLSIPEDETIYEDADCMVKFDLGFDATEIGDGVRIILSYNKDVYDLEMVKGLLKHYRSLLTVLLDNGQESIDNVQFLSASEQSNLLAFNENKVEKIPYPTLLEAFQTQVRSSPEKLAIHFNEQELSFQELDQRSNQLGHYLQQQGIQAEDFIPICMDRSPEMVVGILGVLKAGGAYVPIDPAYPEDRIKFILKDINAQHILTSTEYADLFTTIKTTILETFDFSEYSTDIPANKVKPESLAYAIYTSGSTGRPKGVMIEQHALMNYLSWAGDYYLGNPLSNNNFGLFTAPSFDLTITSIFLPILNGGVLKIFDPETDVLDVLKTYLTSEISCVKLTPAHVSLLQDINIQNKHLELAVVGGEELKRKHIEILKDINPAIKIYNEYGPTEATVGCVVYEVNDSDESILIGKPIRNMGVYLLNQSNQLVPLGVSGEVCVEGAGLSRGYLNLPELTAQKFIDHPFKKGKRLYKTGDIAAWMPDGNLSFKGRIDDQVKIQGYRIELGEIEQVLEQQEYIRQASVQVHTQQGGNKELVAYIVLERPTEHIVLEENLRKRLPDYMVPRIYIELEQMPLTPNGKVDRKALPIPAQQQVVVTFVAPKTEHEQILVAAWSAILKIDKISVKANFYRLGGGSIETIQLINFLKKKGYELQVREAIQYPILEDMAKVLRLEYQPETQMVEGHKVETDFEERRNIISENQKYFIQRSWDMISSPMIALNNFSELSFETTFRNLLGHYESFLLRFEKEGEDILHVAITAEQIPLEIKILRQFDPNDLAAIQKTADDYLRRRFNYFDGSALFRVFLVIDPTNQTRAYLRFCIAHAYVDVDTFKSVADNLVHSFEHPVVSVQSFSNVDFANWQYRFLNTQEGQSQRQWWSGYLNTLILPEKENSFDEASIDFVVLEKTISGSEYEKTIKRTADALSLPVTVVILAAFQRLLYELDSTIQLIAINGKETQHDGIDIEQVKGLTTNFLPLSVINPSNKTAKQYIFDVFEQYLTVRMYQKIPFEVIRNDFMHQTDIANNIHGYFNFINLDKNRKLDPGQISREVDRRIEPSPWKDVYGIGLICNQYQNGLSLKLMYPLKNEQGISMDNFIKEIIFGITNAVSEL